ncbi:MAG TPA: hypothetical protein VMU76_13200 [Acidimicrobiales bacterium]|nr:hypothetical protein [Acidimicrobiales bacterium]
MTSGDRGLMLELTAERRAPLAGLVEAWLSRRSPEGKGDVPVVVPGHRVEVREVEVLLAGRPGLLDVLADVDGHGMHAVLGVRADGGEQAPEPGGDGRGLGLIHDDEGLASVIDALHDTELAPLVLAAVTGREPERETVNLVRDDDDETVVEFDARCCLTVFPRVLEGPHRGVEMLLALDEAGFNHLAAPLAVWRRGGHDLGVVQELLAGSAGGWALALTSLRDLYGSGGRPEEAGGDFGPEAQALGTMTARMHLALDRAFGREVASVAELADQVEAGVARIDPTLLRGEGALAALARVRASGVRAPMIRTHGDFHLGRTARTDLGWVVSDCSPGGQPPGADAPAFRSPLADVVDMLWSMHHVSAVATAERDPTGRGGPTSLARAWASRNRGAFLTAYLATPGIEDLVGADRALVRDLVTVLELERATTLAAQSTPG